MEITKISNPDQVSAILTNTVEPIQQRVEHLLSLLRTGKVDKEIYPDLYKIIDMFTNAQVDPDKISSDFLLQYCIINKIGVNDNDLKSSVYYTIRNSLLKRLRELPNLDNIGPNVALVATELEMKTNSTALLSEEFWKRRHSRYKDYRNTLFQKTLDDPTTVIGGLYLLEKSNKEECKEKLKEVVNAHPNNFEIQIFLLNYLYKDKNFNASNPELLDFLNNLDRNPIAVMLSSLHHLKALKPDDYDNYLLYSLRFSKAYSECVKLWETDKATYEKFASVFRDDPLSRVTDLQFLDNLAKSHFKGMSTNQKGGLFSTTTTIPLSIRQFNQFELAYQELEIGNLDKAIELFEASSRRGNVNATLFLSKIYESIGDNEKAYFYNNISQIYFPNNEKLSQKHSKLFSKLKEAGITSSSKTGLLKLMLLEDEGKLTEAKVFSSAIAKDSYIATKFRFPNSANYVDEKIYLAHHIDNTSQEYDSITNSLSKEGIWPEATTLPIALLYGRSFETLTLSEEQQNLAKEYNKLFNDRLKRLPNLIERSQEEQVENDEFDPDAEGKEDSKVEIQTNEKDNSPSSKIAREVHEEIEGPKNGITLDETKARLGFNTDSESKLRVALQAAEKVYEKGGKIALKNDQGKFVIVDSINVAKEMIRAEFRKKGIELSASSRPH